jgi:Fe2+ or Zn2+ uptake regulation protein
MHAARCASVPSKKSLEEYFDLRVWQDRSRLVCFKCGKIQDVQNSEFQDLKRAIADETGFEVRVTTLELRGICRGCRAAKAQSVA